MTQTNFILQWSCGTPYLTMELWYALSYDDAVVRLILRWSCGTPYPTMTLWYAHHDTN